ncbi:MAG TPA: TonB-dependent receptor [Rhodanobacter sp.]|jgi:outer membrane receptor protein involved in Fe transport|nr:TonB-dependent receptor [Rhodanobacter sp.]
MALAALSAAASAAPPVQQLGEVVVIGITPLPGLNVPLQQVPLNVQTAQADDVEQIHGQSLTDLLQRNFQGVNVTQSQGNPWQGNLLFRGFTLSPLLGSPSGMSVYVDGVRQNEAFAGTINWEAIPDFAIHDVRLIPGSSPLFGLNTLGGALLLTTKNGFTDPGGALDVSAGAWGRVQADADFGVHGKTFGLYAGVGTSSESGWRDYSPSRVQQVFLRADWRPDDVTSIALSYTGAHAKLDGTQALPLEWASRPESAFTWPDFFVNNLSQFNLQGARQLDHDWALQANAYLRISQSRSFNSNTNDYDVYDPADAPLGYTADGPFDPDSLGRYYYAGLTPAYDSGNPAATINNVPASNVLGNVHARGFGASFQAVGDSSPAGHLNQFTVGVSLDVGDSVFNQSGQPAFFSYEAASRGASMGLQPFGLDLMTAAGSSARSYGVYFMDVVTLTDAVHFSAGGRYNHDRLRVSDLSGSAPDINGRQSFSRFNPSLGFTWSVSKAFGAYVNYDEGMRTPTPIEVECANPETPCALPNDFTGDPLLKPVVVRTLSGGLRGTFAGGRLHWNVSPYASSVDNDILTIYTGGSSQGYFANVPKTLRKGADLGLGGQLDRLEWQANYSHVNATYGVAFEELAADNSSAADDGAIQVHGGGRMPGVPRNVFTFAGEYHRSNAWSFGGNMRACSNQYAVGDENNRDRHGAVPGYVVLDLDLHCQPTPALSFFAEISNVFNRHYFLNGALSKNVFNTPNHLIDTDGPGTSTLFVAPGAPRGYLVGLRYNFGGAVDGGGDG